jgi:phosphoribosyl 1,2-cyclic phosphodiesterase
MLFEKTISTKKLSKSISTMELKILGSSSRGNCYIMETDHDALIIEAGVKLIEVKKAIGFNLSKVEGCLVSHRHNDHAGNALEYANAGIMVLALQDVIAAKGIERNYKAIEFGKGYKVGRFKVIPFEVIHDVPCAGYIVDHPESGKVMFITDTYACKYRFTGLSHILIEANYADDILTENIVEGRVPQAMRQRLLTSHMEIEATKNILITTDLKRVRNIVLIHLSDGNSNERRFVEECKAVTGKKVVAASAGMVLQFNAMPV